MLRDLPGPTGIAMSEAEKKDLLSASKSNDKIPSQVKILKVPQDTNCAGGSQSALTDWRIG